MTTLTVIAMIGAAYQAPTIGQYVQSNLDDATIVARIIKADQRELIKINRDFGTSYRFERTTVYFKEPFMLRAEASVEDTSVRYIINGNTKKLIVRGKTVMTDNLAKEPGKRQTPLDFGILTPSLFSGLFVAKYVRNDRATGDVVFDLTYQPSLDDTTRHRIWIDPVRKYVTKREWYNQRGRQLATFVYESPLQENGVWLPTRLTVRNVDNKIAGVTSYTELKVNSGLSDSLFQG